MHDILIELLGVRITGWKMIGYGGVCLYSARWFIQMWASRKAEKPVIPTIFWMMSMTGSLMCLAYFVFGKNDSVGILSNLFPSFIAAYNLRLEFKHRRRLRRLADLESSSQPVEGTAAPGFGPKVR